MATASAASDVESGHRMFGLRDASRHGDGAAFDLQAVSNGTTAAQDLQNYDVLIVNEMVHETRKIMGDDSIQVNPTAEFAMWLGGQVGFIISSTPGIARSGVPACS